MNKVTAWLGHHRKQIGISAGVLAVVIVLLQLLYPNDRMPLFASVDGLSVSAWKKTDAIYELNKRSREQPVAVRLSKSTKAYDSPLPADIGITTAHDSRINEAGYPMIVRVVPTSALWYGLLESEEQPEYTRDQKLAARYIADTLKNCDIPALNATVQFEKDLLRAVKAKNGGTCNEKEVVAQFATLKPSLVATTAIDIDVKEKPPIITNAVAEDLAQKLNAQSKNGVQLTVNEKTLTVAQPEVLSWLTFKDQAEVLNFEIDPAKAAPYLTKNVTTLVTKPAGTTRITTNDFAVVSEQKGATGTTLNSGETVASVKEVLKGNVTKAVAKTTSLAPKVVYTRTYSKTSTGIAALIKFYDEDHPGTFGVSFRELSGGLSASHNSSAQYVTASTYKLFVAFSTLLKVDKGEYKWTDENIAGGRSLSQCFDDMIVKSDNPCAEALLKKVGRKQLDSDLRSIGLSSTTFQSSNNLTTASNLSSYLEQLATGKLPVSSAGRDRLLGAMKRNVYRQGIPKGASGQVADKVGFLWGLLHDAAIVYSPKGTYVLTVMSDGSSWANIAELTRQIEALR